MKTLIVKYLPGQEYSNTRKLYDYTLHRLEGKDVNVLDLEKDQPVFFTNQSLLAYYSRNYQGNELSHEQQNAIAQMDHLTEMVKNADIIMLFHPMHNFGMPGIIKTWFDNIMQKGVAFEYGSDGRPVGLFAGKKAMTVFTSAGKYPKDRVTAQYPEWDTLSLLTKIEYTFMGITDVEIVSASTVDKNALEQNLEKAKTEIDDVLQKWYEKL